MEFHPFQILVASMFCNFIVLGISINRPDSFYPVSLSAISISLQGLALRHFAIISVRSSKVSIRLFKRLKIGELPFQGVSFRFKTPCFGSRGSEVQILSPRPFKTMGYGLGRSPFFIMGNSMGNK